jgi:hypothetical protein
MIHVVRVDPSKVQPLRDVLLERAAGHDAEAAACVQQAEASRRRAAALHTLVQVIRRQLELVADAHLVSILEMEAATFEREARLCDSEATRHDAEASRASAQAETARTEARAVIARP